MFPFGSRRRQSHGMKYFYAFLGFVLFGGIGLMAMFNPPTLEEAAAQTPTQTIEMFPGQVITVSVFYDNANQTSDFVGPAQLKLELDERLEYLQGSLKDSYAGSGQKCVNDTLGQGIRSQPVVASNRTITRIEYTPRTATINPVNGNCESGNGARGLTQDITLPRAPQNFNVNNQSTWRGRLEFRLKLREEVLEAPYNLSLGDVIPVNEPNGDFGLQHEFQMRDTVIGGAAYQIQIAGQNLDAETSIQVGDCFNQPVVIGSAAICQFNLVGTDDTFVFPSDFRIRIDTAIQGSSSGSCSIIDSSLLRCEVPTSGATAGTRNVQITSNGKTTVRATIELTRQFVADQDDDQDGLFNGLECGNNTGQECLDTDLDGIQDYRDTDSDDDGIPDLFEKNCNEGVGEGNPCDTDGDGIPDYIDIDSDQDGVLDGSEKGEEYECNFDVLPAQCTGQLSDTNDNNIPAYRDIEEQVGVQEEDAFLIPNELIFLDSLSGQFPVFKRDTAVINVQFERNIINCSMSFRPASSSQNWIPIRTRVVNNLCTGTVNGNSQRSNQLEFNIDIRDENGTRWGANPSYRLQVGSLGITVPRAEIPGGPLES
jgi:hypothetical protein